MRKRTKIQIRSAASRKAARTRKRMKEARRYVHEVSALNLSEKEFEELKKLPLEQYHDRMVDLLAAKMANFLVDKNRRSLPNPFDEIGA